MWMIQETIYKCQSSQMDLPHYTDVSRLYWVDRTHSTCHIWTIDGGRVILRRNMQRQGRWSQLKMNCTHSGSMTITQLVTYHIWIPCMHHSDATPHGLQPAMMLHRRNIIHLMVYFTRYIHFLFITFFSFTIVDPTSV